MAEVSRRALLRGASGAAAGAAAGAVIGGGPGALVGGGPGAAAPASVTASVTAETTSGGRTGVVEQIVRDAQLVWQRPPTSWQTAPFLANGFLGVQVYRAPQENVLKFMLSHSHVQDERVQWEAAIGLSRLPIGYLTLTLAGAITAVDWRLDLWNAELTGTVTTTQGGVAFTALVHNTRTVLLVSLTPTAGEEGATWAFQPLPSATTRTIRKPPDYVPNPPPTVGSADGVSYAEQPMLAGGGYTTAWQEVHLGTRRLLAATVSYAFPEPTSTADAVRRVRDALAADPRRLAVTHRWWWHRFYGRSLVSVPDKRLQRFYWIQLYKAAAATRADAPVVTEWGPWFPEVGNSWTAVWWNLNVQVAYPLINGSNHPELDAVTATFRRFEANLELSVPPAYRDGDTYALSHPGDRTLRPGGTRTVGIPGPDNGNDQTGNLIWGLHTAWLAYRHAMDDRVLRHVIYPILARALNYYLTFLAEGPDGRLHLPQTRSPEYANATDCAYDLSLIRWACATLIDSARRLRIGDPRIQRWADVLARLVPYHQDPAAGVMIGAGVPLADSHRHFSHLLWLWPLQESSWERPADRDLMRRTFNHWTSMQQRWHGYSFAAASSMCSIMDAPEEGLAHLTFFIDGNVVDNCQLTPNTMYREGSNFAIESPLAAAQSVLDMLVQSHGGVVKVFPAVSSTWADASIAGLRTQGAFVVDASRSQGRTDWIRVRSEAGEPLVLHHGIAGEIDVRDERGRPIRCVAAGEGRVRIPLRRGGTAVVTRSGDRPDLTPRDVPGNGATPPWGLPV
ncbi:MAG TPA: Tat pathway signal sequence domain protein [Pilimelia sp.]|nr:Tat pathway signal sequence domain protein [Pilimelia sp.]